MNAQRLAQEIMAASARREVIAVPPAARDGGLTLPAAYAVEAELTRLRAAEGHRTVGRKVGYANRALWRVFGLDTVVWAHMYEDTVRQADQGVASLGVGRLVSPKIEPEIVFKLRHAPSGELSDPGQVLRAVEWLAPGFEVVDCPYADWKFQPSDFVAAFGLHAALIVGEPLRVTAALIPALAEQLAGCKARLWKDGALVAEGGGAKVLGSPALCLGELAAGLTRHTPPEPLAAGELVASGALTENRFIAPGETWTAVVEGIDLPELSLRTTA